MPAVEKIRDFSDVKRSAKAMLQAPQIYPCAVSHPWESMQLWLHQQETHCWWDNLSSEQLSSLYIVVHTLFVVASPAPDEEESVTPW